MRVSLRLYSVLQKSCPAFSDFREIELENGTHITDILIKIGIPMETPVIIFVNKTSVDLKYELKDGDKIEVLPPVSGG